MSWVTLFGLVCLASPPGPGTVEASAVGQAIAERRSRVEEFRLIKEAAEELGIRVWLFGGTAAGFAHYVRWDLARESGDPRYRQSFFDYDFTNIYRSTQDADLVVDATPEQAEQLEGLVRQKMSFLQGSKEHWEVRLLRQDRTVGNGQVKQALLHNPDFLEQNTDSNSTGMIELTEPSQGESVVKDLRDWDSPTPFFLQDVTQGRLHYYQSPTHQETSRFKSGDNPPIFSVIRYLVKAFQYDLQVEGEDLKKVQAIIDAFDPQQDLSPLTPWAKGWLERYAPNLFRHSVNIEYAWDTLERLGLRQKLVATSNPAREGTLGWWLSREPLRSRAVGEGQGRTAAELGIEVVAHETRDFPAYESITRDTTLKPNVLISRPDHVGENAALGPGFYTRLGTAGARGTGLTIRFQVDPNAREGTDFTVHSTPLGEFVLLTNRAALQVIPESLDVTLLQYFQLIHDGLINPQDRGAWIKLKRRLLIRPVGEEEEREIAALIDAEIDRLAREGGRSLGGAAREQTSYWGMGSTDAPSLHAPLFREWFALPFSERHPELLRKLVAVVSRAVNEFSRERETTSPTWDRTSKARAVVMDWLSLPVSRDYPQLLDTLIQQSALGYWDLQGLAPWIDDPLVILAAIEREGRQSHSGGWQPGDQNDPNVANNVLGVVVHEPPWEHNAALLALCGGYSPNCLYMKKPFEGGVAFQVVEGLAAFEDRPDLVRLLMENPPPEARPSFAASAAVVEWLSQHWERHLDWLRERPEFQSRPDLLDPRRWAEDPQLVLALIGQVPPHRRANWERIQERLSGQETERDEERADREAWEGHRRRLERGGPRKQEEREVVALISREVARFTEERGSSAYSLRPERWRVLQEWLALPLARSHPGLLEPLMDKQALGPHELGLLPGWVDDPRIPLTVVARAAREAGTKHFYLIDRALAAPQWKTHPHLWALCGGNAPTAACLHDLLQSETLEKVTLGLARLSQVPVGADRTELFQALLQAKLFRAAAGMLGSPDWQGRPELALELIAAVPPQAMTFGLETEIVGTAGFWQHPEILRALLARNDGFRNHVRDFLVHRGRGSAGPRDNPGLVLTLLEWMDQTYPPGLGVIDPWFDSILERGGWREQSGLRALCGGEDPSAACLRQALLGRSVEEIASGMASLSSFPEPGEECRPGT